MSNQQQLHIAVPVPLRQSFTYAPANRAMKATPGMRVRVSFGRQTLVGVVLPRAIGGTIEKSFQIKPINEVIDDRPVLDARLMRLILWSSQYYQHAIGEVVSAALPKKLRDGVDRRHPQKTLVCLTDQGRRQIATISRSPRQKELLQLLQQSDNQVLDLREIQTRFKSSRSIIDATLKKSWIELCRSDDDPAPKTAVEVGPQLTREQSQALDSINTRPGFRTWVLYGVTGSGKTEVYLQLIRTNLAQNKQVLVLIPEIALTPQLQKRFQSRLPTVLAVLHSGLSDSERLRAWQLAAEEKAGVVLGTRSAVFTAMPSLGLIIIDEEHDLAFKQQEGFRYHARDIAIKRAQQNKIPVVLGSATPSLESMKNVQQGKYQILRLSKRIHLAKLPQIRLIDTNRLRLHNGLSDHLRDAIEERLEKGQQTILFINRRGYAPLMLCAACGWLATCPRCDSRMTYHHKNQQLRCHHCGQQKSSPPCCPECGDNPLHTLGEGTQRLELGLQAIFPHARILRVDRDTVQRRGALANHLDQIARHEVDLVVGTQLLSKGHDFPKVTLVGIINTDQRLFSMDFRAGEQLFQQITQVSGRAGRHRIAGEVILQTAFPEHPYFAFIRQHDYNGFVVSALAEREESRLPPYTHLALFRAESTQVNSPLRLLSAVRHLGLTLRAHQSTIEIYDPISAPMPKRAGKYRAQLLVQAANRSTLGRFLQDWLQRVPSLPESRLARWSIDVDPMDMY